MSKHMDTGSWPVVRINYESTMSRGDIEEILATMVSLLRKRERFAYISDLRSGFSPDAKQRQLIADYYRDNVDALKRYVAAGATVTDTPQAGPQHGAALAISWQQAPPFPRDEFADVPSAERWVQSKLDGN